jgi:hypothetical protein
MRQSVLASRFLPFSSQLYNFDKSLVCEFLGFRSGAVEVSALRGLALRQWVNIAQRFETQ